MKRFISLQDQISRLENSNVIFSDKRKAAEILYDIGFYRLGFYAFPFEKTYPQLENRSHYCREGTTFEQIVDLYYFDTDLRNILLRMLHRIEINIRTRIIYMVSGTYINDPYWFASKNVMDNRYLKDFEQKVYRGLKENPVIARHHKNHPEDRFAPAWKTIEFMTLGNLAFLYKGLQDQSLKERIAQSYKCSVGVFLNYFDALLVLRNRCAHGNCLFSLTLPKGVKLRPANIDASCRQHIAGLLAVVRYFLLCISLNRAQDFEQDIRTLVNAHRNTETNRIIDDCTKIKTLSFV